MKNIKSLLLTPEALSEIVFENSIEKYDDAFTRQYISLAQDELYYAILIDESKKCLCMNDIHMEALKRNGIYGYESLLATLFEDKPEKDNGSKQDLKYYQLKEEAVEKFIYDAIKAIMPKKLLRNRNIDFIYKLDASTCWNYHEKADKPILHVRIATEKEKQEDLQIINSWYQ